MVVHLIDHQANAVFGVIFRRNFSARELRRGEGGRKRMKQVVANRRFAPS